MRKGFKQERLGEEIKRTICEMLLKDVKDPALSGFVNISDVVVSGDGSHATCYVTVLGSSISEDSSPEEKERVLNAFNKAKGLFKGEIARRVKVRRIPELAFKIDSSLEYGRRISKVLREIGNGDDDEK
ncbi:MAG: 30S ribosome-binding factor RbfA [Anaerovoracaceae bacterium]|nr:30S ribosome-binding factor RbfA [Clostridiales bacterium]